MLPVTTSRQHAAIYARPTNLMPRNLNHFDEPSRGRGIVLVPDSGRYAELGIPATSAPYNGKRTLPKTHVARMRISMPATTDYWINDTTGEPLFVVTTEANAGLVKMLPDLCKEIRGLVGERRVTIVFDRGGWSPKLFSKLIADGFDIHLPQGQVAETPALGVPRAPRRARRS
jgi:hypothetical protein